MKLLAIGCVLLAVAVSIDANLLLTPHAIRERVQKQLGNPNKAEGSPYALREAVFVQWIDHFDLDEFLTFDQIVYINDNYYQPGGPVFIYVQTYSNGFTEWMEYSHMTTIAQQLNGVIYALEPRYTGRSRPTDNLDDSSLNQYLTLNQSIADFADFITYLRLELSAYGSDKFILYGMDTGATLATWIHQSNSGLVDGVWAIGAPVTVAYEFSAYFADATESIVEIIRDLDNPECGYVLNNAFYDLENLVFEGQSERISELFGLSQIIDLENPNEIAVFYYLVYSVIGTHVDYGSAIQVGSFCDYLLYNNDLTEIEKLGYYIGGYLFDTTINYNQIVSLLRDTTWTGAEAIADTRQFYHLACRQWSWFRTSNYLEEPINGKFPSETFSNLCYDVFGVSQLDTIDGNIRTNNQYTIRVSLPNVYFTNGALDPTRLISIRENLNAFSPADVIPGLGKAFELVRYLSAEYQTAEILAVQDRATNLITSWTS